jgi:hypothetical protein
MGWQGDVGTPRATFAMDEVCVSVCCTDPPIRGVHVPNANVDFVPR